MNPSRLLKCFLFINIFDDAKLVLTSLNVVQIEKCAKEEEEMCDKSVLAITEHSCVESLW